MDYSAGLVRCLIQLMGSALRHLTQRSKEEESQGHQAITWLHARTVRLAALFVAIRAGTLKPRRPATTDAAAPPASPTPARAPTGPGAGRFPRGWLHEFLPDIEAETEDLLHAIHSPEAEPLFQQEPERIGRLLRPICHALAIALPKTLARAKPPPAPAPEPRPATAAEPRPRPPLPTWAPHTTVAAPDAAGPWLPIPPVFQTA